MSAHAIDTAMVRRMIETSAIRGDSCLLATEKPGSVEMRQVLQLFDAFIECGHLKRQVEESNAQAPAYPRRTP